MGLQDDSSGPHTDGRSRREFIRDAAAFGGTLIGAPALLSATASGHTLGVDAAKKHAKPKMGGNLIIGLDGGTATESLNPFKGSGGNPHIARSYQLFERLAGRDHNFNLTPLLATEFIPNKAGDQVVVKLRGDVEFHNGKSMTADDIVFSFNYMLNPQSGSNVGPLLQPFITAIDKLDTLTVRFVFNKPFTGLQDLSTLSGAAIVPAGGYDPTQPPVGTGPFMYQSFTPGQQSVFVRNPNYWGTGPYVDTLTLIDFPDPTARVNALLSGAVEAVASVPFALLPTVKAQSNLEALVSKTGNWNPITMRVDQPPFNDVRVRQAFRLIVDRPQMVTSAYGGQATLGNDLYASTDPLFDHSLPQRKQDIEQAKHLLKKAGQSNLTVQLVAAEVAAGVTESCVVFAQQAQAAGVNVQITKLDTTTFFSSDYLQRTFSVDNWPTLSFIVNTAYSCAPGATYSETHFSNPKFNKWYYELLAAKSLSLQKEIAAEMQKMLYDEGGEIIVAIPNQIDAYSNKLTGFVPDKSGVGLSHYRFKDVSFV